MPMRHRQRSTEGPHPSYNRVVRPSQGKLDRVKNEKNITIKGYDTQNILVGTTLTIIENAQILNMNRKCHGIEIIEM